MIARQAEDAMMKTSARYVITAATGMVLPLPALAHWGHLGELAGHGHLIGAGLGAMAVIGVAGLAVPGNETEQDADGAVDDLDVSVEEDGKTHA